MAVMASQADVLKLQASIQNSFQEMRGEMSGEMNVMSDNINILLRKLQTQQDTPSGKVLLFLSELVGLFVMSMPCFAEPHLSLLQFLFSYGCFGVVDQNIKIE